MRHSLFGFTLIELAMVLFIVSLLLGGLLVPLATQVEGRNRQLAQRKLDDIKEALIGFAIINGRLPCPTTQTDPADAAYGSEDAACNVTVTTEGFLPWKTLGVSAYDQWGVTRVSSADPWNGYWRYRVDRNFSLPFNLGTGTIDNLTVQDSQNNTLTSTTERPIAIVYSTGANQTQDGQNSSYEQNPSGNATGTVPNGYPLYQGGEANNVTVFDDITIWLTRPLLFNRMVVSGKLP
ncbi:MAG: type II secretion system protein [Gammaproteobacteria bacterium]